MRGTTGSAAAPATCRNCLRWGSFILNLPSHHSITSSATSSVGGTARPSVLAVLRLYDKLVFCWRLHRQVFAFEEASHCSCVPPWRSSSNVPRPYRHKFLAAPLDHDWHRKRVESGLIELNRAARHRFGPAAFEAHAVQGFGHRFRLCRLRSLDRLHEHLKSDSVLDRFMHHEVAEAFADRIGQYGSEIVV